MADTDMVQAETNALETSPFLKRTRDGDVRVQDITLNMAEMPVKGARLHLRVASSNKHEKLIAGTQEHQIKFTVRLPPLLRKHESHKRHNSITSEEALFMELRIWERLSPEQSHPAWAIIRRHCRQHNNSCNLPWPHPRLPINRPEY
jgi:hypothetical protein